MIAEEQPEPVSPPPEPFVSEKEPALSKDASNPDWEQDFDNVFWNFFFPLSRQSEVFDDQDLEMVKNCLEAVGYDAAPAGVILKLLRNKGARSWAATHIVASVVLDRTNPENESSSPLLPLSSELRKNLCAAFHAFEGMKFK
jgi:hypothetical protein